MFKTWHAQMVHANSTDMCFLLKLGLYDTKCLLRTFCAEMSDLCLKVSIYVQIERLRLLMRLWNNDHLKNCSQSYQLIILILINDHKPQLLRYQCRCSTFYFCICLIAVVIKYKMHANKRANKPCFLLKCIILEARLKTKTCGFERK